VAYFEVLFSDLPEGTEKTTKVVTIEAVFVLVIEPGIKVH
jgi:hypothetical protein